MIVSRLDLWYNYPAEALVKQGEVDLKGEVELPGNLKGVPLFIEVADGNKIQVVQIEPTGTGDHAQLLATTHLSFKNRLPKESVVTLEGGQTALFVSGGEETVRLDLPVEFVRLFASIEGETFKRFAGSSKSVQLSPCILDEEEPIAPQFRLEIKPYISQSHHATIEGSLLSDDSIDSITFATSLYHQTTALPSKRWKGLVPLEEGWNLVTVEGGEASPNCSWIYGVPENDCLRPGVVMPVWISTADSSGFQAVEKRESKEEGMSRLQFGLQMAQSALQRLFCCDDLTTRSFRIANEREVEEFLKSAENELRTSASGLKIAELNGGVEVVLPQKTADYWGLKEELSREVTALLSELFAEHDLIPISVFAMSRWSPSDTKGILEPLYSKKAGVLLSSTVLWSWPKSLTSLSELWESGQTAESVGLLGENWERKDRSGVFGASMGRMMVLLLCAMGLDCSDSSDPFFSGGYSWIDAFWNPTIDHQVELSEESRSLLLRSRWLGP